MSGRRLLKVTVFLKEEGKKWTNEMMQKMYVCRTADERDGSGVGLKRNQ
jgi:hypothetical protein